MMTTEKNRGRNNTPTRRFPSLRNRSGSRGRSATPTNGKKDKDKEDSSSTPSKNKFKFKKLIPRNNSRSRKTSSASPSPAPKPSRVGSKGNGSKGSSHNHNAHTTSQRETIESVIVSPKQTRSVNDNHTIEPAGERDAPESATNEHGRPSSSSTTSSSGYTPQTQTKRIHNASERDGFCRRVDYYDGQTIHIDSIPTYEVGNYLGGGVAGVVYEGQRLRPLSDYPVRSSYQEMLWGAGGGHGNTHSNSLIDLNNGANSKNGNATINRNRSNSLISSVDGGDHDQNELLAADHDHKNHHHNTNMTIGHNTSQEHLGGCTGIFCGRSHSDLNNIDNTNDLKLAVEKQGLIDTTTGTNTAMTTTNQMTTPQSKTDELMDETVAIKILNPVGFRLLSPSACASAVVVQRGIEMDHHVQTGTKPMTEEHVWWLVNPSSKNLRTLQRNPSPIVGKDGEKMGLSPDLYNRGSRDHGIRLSLVAAYMDPKSNNLRELPLTRCIEIWGHAPFGTTEEEFENMMDAIERVNQGLKGDEDNGIGDSTSGSNSSLNSRTSGLFRAAVAPKITAHCKQLNAYITVPAVPPKYIRWLRQRRAVTKEIRNMMRIGRHKNVVHLYEVMELIQDSKSVMFLVLELVKGGELFDLISTNSSTVRPMANEALSHLTEGEQNEFTMLNFFKELASGIAYCHANGIAHRDLKPENLLVHNESNGNCTLKIADFGLSSTFALNKNLGNYSSQNGISCGALNTPNKQPPSPSPVTGFSPLITHKLSSALSFLTCGGMEQITECFGSFSDEPSGNATALNRMTSIVGSPHYVAPEIISQTDDNKKQTSSVLDEVRGYDGTKADVWSAGVILYAMLFRSLPFGEDLLRCPRYQSFTKWYKEARNVADGRRASAAATLTPIDIVRHANDLGPHWFFPSKTSPDSKDIIMAMLNPNPVDRLDIQEVLIHPWMKMKIQ